MKDLTVKLTVNADDRKSGYTFDCKVSGDMIAKVGYDQAVKFLEEDLVRRFRESAAKLKPRCTGDYGHLSVIKKK